MPQLVTCPCQHCNGKLEFDPATLSEENKKITCPHCSLDTILFVPPPTDAKLETILSPPPPPPKVNIGKLAKLAPIQGVWTWKVEKKLDDWADLFIGIGILGLIGGVVAAFAVGSDSLFWLFVASGIGIVVNAGVAYALLKGVAELIRLHKKQAGLPVSGYFIFECSECKTKLTGPREECPRCGLRLQK
jgi:DNA-directed RNA polymerase subunit RPC12/RpoP